MEKRFLYSRDAAARALSISVRSLDHLITSNRIAVRRIGARIFLTPGELQRFAQTDQPVHIWDSLNTEAA